MIVTSCTRCGRLVSYRSNSDLLDGHRCPDGSAPWIERVRAKQRAESAAAVLAERTASPRPASGGPVGDEVWSESQMERESLDAAEPPKTPDEDEMAEVVYLRVPRCALCGGLPGLRWDESQPLTCSNCGAGITADGAA